MTLRNSHLAVESIEVAILRGCSSTQNRVMNLAVTERVLGEMRY